MKAFATIAARELIANRLIKEGRTERTMQEMEWDEFLESATQMVKNGIIEKGFNSIEHNIHHIITLYMQNEIFVAVRKDLGK